MSAKELERKSQIERALDKRITQKEAAQNLEISERQIRRLIQQFRKEGAGGLVSKKRGVPSNRKISAEVEKQAIAFMTSTLLRDGTSIDDRSRNTSGQDQETCRSKLYARASALSGGASAN